MTLSEAKMAFANKLATDINESKLPPTVIRIVLADMDRAVAQLEEQQFQSALNAEEGGENDA
jgi:hypothetical protein